MNAIRTVNLLWEKKWRGTYAVSRFALDDTGTVTLAVARPLEARTYDLTRLSTDESTEIRLGFSVETLLKTELSPSADDFIGMTSDGLYLFQGGQRSRFLAEKRIIYVDAALSEDGQRFAAGFSDMAGTSYTLVLGEIGGRTLWSRDVDATLTALALSRDGRRIAFGAENGTLQMVDTQRRDVWIFEQSEPIRALACSTDGVYTAYGTVAGAVGLIDGDGKRLWEARCAGEILAVTVAGKGQVCAVLYRADAETGATGLACLTATGQVGWELVTEKRLTGMALSPSGHYLALSGRDGTQAIYEVVPGEAAGASIGGGSGSLEEARLLRESGDWAGALRMLQALADADLGDIAQFDRCEALRQTWRTERLTAAQQQEAQGNYAEALALYAPFCEAEPPDAEILARSQAAAQTLAQQRLAFAQSLLASGDASSAESTLLEALAYDRTLRDARQTLHDLRGRMALEADAAADHLLALGDFAEGVAVLERAQAIAPTSERAAKLSRAQIAQEFALGLTHYNEKRYAEAVFQFQKVLARDRAHSEAQRYLNFAQRFAQDTTTDTLSDRFSRLE